MFGLRHRWKGVLLAFVALAALVAVAAACGDDEEEQQLKIGLLVDFTGDLAQYGPSIANGAELAVKHLNEAGGVLGNDVVLVQGDSATSVEVGVQEATRLIEVEGVSAIVGSLASGVTIAIAEGVTVPSKVVLISPASTSAALTDVEDNDYLFRTTLSDTGQGVILAQLAQELGYDNVATIYINNAYGQGLSNGFAAAFEALGGTVSAQVSSEQEQPTYLAELQAALAGQPDALAAITYPESAGVYLREALENGLIDTFLFVDGTKAPAMFEALGYENFEGLFGTAPGAEETPGVVPFKEAYEAEFGEQLPIPFIQEAYDAVICIALAAEAAGSTDSTAIRDNLREVCGPPGTEVVSGAEGIAQALELVRDGEDVDYSGAAGFQDFNENGDVLSGIVEIWKIENGQITSVRFEPVRLD